ncbi:MAG: metallophosphoesterase [Mariprofundales bacterium]
MFKGVNITTIARISAIPTLLHLTDMHLYTDDKQELKGVRTLASFRAVKSLAWQSFPNPDMVLLGGDLAQDDLTSTYRQLGDDLHGWCDTVRFTPGNHFRPSAMARTLFPALAIPPMEQSVVTLGAWQVVPLNSHDAQASPRGLLGDSELQRLESLLQASKAEHLLLALHHHPIAVDCPWMDAMMLEGADRLWELIEASGRVRAVLFGHTHQEVDSDHDGVRLLGTPATSIQFKPKTISFELDAQSPGFRSLQLQDDGTIQTTVHRVHGFLPDLDDSESYLRAVSASNASKRVLMSERELR